MDSVPEVSDRGWSCRYPAPRMYPRPRLSAGKMFIISRMVRTNSLGTVSYSYHLEKVMSALRTVYQAGSLRSYSSFLLPFR